MTAPDWQINVVGPDYADIQEGQARVAVYDYAVSNSDPVYAETIIATGEFEDDWYSPEDLEADSGEFLPTVRTSIRRVFADAQDEARRRGASAAARSGVLGRVSRGVPAGGQFAAVDRAEAAVSLA